MIEAADIHQPETPESSEAKGCSLQQLVSGHGRKHKTVLADPPTTRAKPRWLARAGTMIDGPRPWIMVCPRSDSHACRTVPDGVWAEAVRRFPGTTFWLGRHKAPKGFVDLQCRHLDNIIRYISVSDLFVSVDTGPAHIAIALGIPSIIIGQSSDPELHFSDQRDFITIKPPLDCLNCQHSICPINKDHPPCQNIAPEVIAAAVNKRIEWTDKMRVSAVVAIYRPKMEMLNRCLLSLIPQVDEIIVVSDQAGVVPSGAMENQKIRYVRSWQNNVGYGRKINYAARHTSGGWLIFVNDDAELHPNCVKNMLVEGVPDVAAVTPLLRYDNQRIQYAGKHREPGVRGWGHIDHNSLDHTYKTATEMENMTGAVFLVRRNAYFNVGGHNENYFTYCEDDDLCLKLRRDGWRLVFTPHATGTHSEHQSTEKTPGIIDIMHASNKIFEKDWGDYLTYNAQRIPGTFDYLSK